jgi:hypothetical protein
LDRPSFAFTVYNTEQEKYIPNKGLQYNCAETMSFDTDLIIETERAVIKLPQKDQQYCRYIHNKSYIKLQETQSIKIDVKIINRTYITKYCAYSYFMEPSDYQDTPLSNKLHFVGSVGLLRG